MNNDCPAAQTFYIYRMSGLFIPLLRKYAAIVLFMMSPVLALSSQHSESRMLGDQERQEKKQDDKKGDRKKSDKKDKPDHPKEDIPEVPKARKQSRPEVVPKPNVKVKPIKVIRPKIKKP